MFNVIRAENELPEGAAEYDYILEVSKHDVKFLEKLRGMGWEQFNKETQRHLDLQGSEYEDMFDVVWMGIKMKDIE